MSGKCAMCGRDPAAGHAKIGDDWYCHPDHGLSCYVIQSEMNATMPNVTITRSPAPVPPGEETP